MAMAISRPVCWGLLVLNFCLYVIVICIAGWALNAAINQLNAWQDVSGSPATQYFVELALVAGVVGVASKIHGAYHLCLCDDGPEKPSTTRPSALASALIAWLLTLLAMGLACKEINWGGNKYKRMKVLEAFVIILSGTQLFYVLVLGAEPICHKYCKSTTSPPPPTTSSKDEVA